MNKSSGDKSSYFWKENFENFQNSEAEMYHFGVTRYPFNLELYDKLMEEQLKPYVEDVTPPLHILDAGGGTGKWTLYFADKGHRVTLLDIAEPMLDVARKVVDGTGMADRVAIDQGSIADLPYDDKVFDFIFSDRNPISHSGRKEDAFKSIREVYRVLKDGGVVLGCVLNRLRKVAQLTMELSIDKAIKLMEEGDLQRGGNEYTHYFLIDELKEALTDAGFKDIRLIPTTIFTELIPSAWLLDEIPVKKCLTLERMGRNINDCLGYGVRLHFLARK